MYIVRMFRKNFFPSDATFSISTFASPLIKPPAIRVELECQKINIVKFSHSTKVMLLYFDTVPKCYHF